MNLTNTIKFRDKVRNSQIRDKSKVIYRYNRKGGPQKWYSGDQERDKTPRITEIEMDRKRWDNDRDTMDKIDKSSHNM